MTESKGYEEAKNSTSSASGYGQFLTSTSKFVFENLCDFDDRKWSSKVALDGDTNMEMMVAYVEYLYEKKDGDLYAAIDSYRGAHSEAYIAKINSYLATKGKSLDSISLSRNLRLFLSNDSTPIDTRFIPYETMSSRNSSVISFGLHSIVYSQSGAFLKFSMILNNLVRSFLVKHEGVPPPI